MADDFTETPGYGTLAAIIPTKSGPYYLKLTALEAIINQQESAFVGMLNSFTVSE